MSLEVGSIVSGKVSGITNFGAFIDLEGNRTGLVHISEVAREYVKDVNAHLKEGQEVKVKILKIEPGGRLSLSIKKALDESSAKPAMDNRFFDKQKAVPLTFEDKMMRFKSDSDERMQSLRRNTDNKRSGGYRRQWETAK